MTTDSCVFCDIIAGLAPAERYRLCGTYVVAFEPRDPVTPGHTLVVPRKCVTDAAANPMVASETMLQAAWLAQQFDSANIITSIGKPATQSIFHLHIHVVPRRAGDGLALPWTGQLRETTP